ncbi:c-type cytochrome [Seonamhaeicola marinus]|uniref:Cytochrome c n=1 Tax=Seonamhaeicola marinus TaxID=1912246 RepID=A0A5D0HSE8_9FLAO|nr:c-type cytochrome [Seonamhaeicola marinus]TYA74061.1 cytochrome c [Seonamhaeicola marinus]
MKGIQFIFGLVIFFGLVALYFINRRPNPTANLQKTEFVCGTKSELDDDILEGKRQFNINCAMCHRLSGNVDPPLLQNNFKNYTLETFQKFLYNEERKRENLFKNVECMQFPNLSHQKIDYIYKYLDHSINSE